MQSLGQNSKSYLQCLLVYVQSKLVLMRSAGMLELDLHHCHVELGL